MAIQGGITITGFIAPTSTSATYPVIDPIYGIDGLRNVTGSTEMLYTGGTGITVERRRAGMIVGLGNGDYYKLDSQPWDGTLNDWTLLNLTGGGNYLSLSGGTVTGNTIFTSGVTANTLTVTGNTKLNGNVDFGTITAPSNLIVIPYSATSANALSADTTGTTFIYSVYAYDSFGNVTQASTPVSVTVTGGTWNFGLTWNGDPNTNTFSVYRTTTNLVNSGTTPYNKLYNAITVNYLNDINAYNPINGTTPPSVSNSTIASRINYSGDSILLGRNLSVGASGTTLFSVNQKRIGSGTISMVNGNSIITGTSTQFTNTFSINDNIIISGNTYTITGITSNTLMSITPITGATASNINYVIPTNSVYGTAAGTKFSVAGNGVTTINGGQLVINSRTQTPINNSVTSATAFTIDNSAFRIVTTVGISNTSNIWNGVSYWTSNYIAYPSSLGETRFSITSGGTTLVVPSSINVMTLTPGGSINAVSGNDIGTTTGIKFGPSGQIQNAAGGNREMSFLTSNSNNSTNFYQQSNAVNLREVGRFTPYGGFLIGSRSTQDKSLFSVRQDSQGAGSVFLTAGSTTINGFNTQFSNTFKVGDTITVTAWTGTSTYTITAVNSDTSLTVSTPYGGNGGNGLLIVTGLTINSGQIYITGATINTNINTAINPSIISNTRYYTFGSYFNVNDFVIISGSSSIDTYQITGFTNADGNTSYGATIDISPAFTGSTGQYNIFAQNAYYVNYSLSGGQRFSVNGNGNVLFGANISGTSSGMWYDSRNGILNIGNPVQQNQYKLEVSGNTRTTNALYVGQLSVPSGLTGTTGTTGFLSAGTYTYTVEAMDIWGRLTTPSNPITVTIPNGVTNGNIILNWDSVSGADAYYINRLFNGNSLRCPTGRYLNGVNDLSTIAGPITAITSGYTYGYIQVDNVYYLPYTGGSPTTYNTSSKFQIYDGNINVIGGATFQNNYYTSSDVTLKMLPMQIVGEYSGTDGITGIVSNNYGGVKSNKLIIQGLAWNSQYGKKDNTAYLQVSNVINVKSPTVDKLSFFVGSTNTPVSAATEVFNLQSNGKINGYLSDSFTLSASSITNGNVSLFSGSTFVSGNMANFKSRFNVGDKLDTGIYGLYTITAITSDSYLNIDRPYSGSTGNTVYATFYSGSSAGYAAHPDGYYQNWRSMFAYDYRGTFTAGTNNDVYTVTGNTGGPDFNFTPAFTSDTTGINTTVYTDGRITIPIKVYSTNNVPYYVTGNTVFNINANGQATLNGKLTVTSGLTGTSASVGSAKFTSGVVTLTNTCITSSSKVFLTVTGPSGSVGIPTRSGTTTNSMQIVSLSAGTTTVQTGDNSTFDYWIIN